MNGWQCPGCGNCYSPFVEKCGACGPRTITTTGSGAALGTPKPTDFYETLHDGVAQAMLYLEDHEIRQYVDATIDVVHAARAGVIEEPS